MSSNKQTTTSVSRIVDSLPSPPGSDVASVVDALPSPPSAMSSLVDSLPAPPSSPLVSASTPATEESLATEVEKRGAFDKPAVTSQPITDQELEVLAKKHGVKSSVLRAGLTSFGGATENKSDFLDKVGSLFNVASAGAGFDVPTKVAKKLMPDNYERAFDELQDLASGRKSIAVKTAEVAAGMFTGASELKGAKTLWEVAKPMAKLGAAAGFGASHKGDEVSGAAIGAVAGGALGAAGHVVLPKVATGISTVIDAVKKRLGTPTEVALFEKGVASGNIDMEKIIATEAERTAESSPMLRSAMLSKRTAPLPHEVNTLVSEQVPDKVVEAALTRGSPMHIKMEQKIRKAAEAEARRSPTWVEGTVLPITEATEDQIRYELAQGVLKKNIISASNRITRGEARTSKAAIANIEEWLSREGGLAPEGQAKVMREAYDSFEQFKHGITGLESQHIALQGTGGFVENVMHGFFPKEQVFRKLDYRSNVGAEGALEVYNSAINQMNIAKNHFKKKIIKLSDSWNKANLTPEQRTSIYDALDRGTVAELPELEAAAAREHKALSDEIRDFANGVLKDKGEGVSLPPEFDPIRIGNRDAFVHKALLDTNETIIAIRSKADEALEDVTNLLESAGEGTITKFGDLTPAQFEKVKELDSVKQLLWPLHSMSKTNIKAGAQLDNALSALNSRESRSAIETSARTTFARSGQIPEYLLEKHLNKLHGKYLENTLSHVFLRKAERDLKLKADLLHAAGDVEGSKKIVESIAGQHGTLAGSLPADFRAKMAVIDSYFDKVAAKHGTNSITGRAALTAKNIPAILHDLSLQIYPNSMGLNIRSALQNQLGTLTKTYPELGAIYGAKNLKTAVWNVARNRAEYVKKAESLGIVQAEHISGMEESIADGLRDSSSGYKHVKGMVQSYARFAMGLHTAAEKNNRAIAVAAAEKLTQDLVENNALALGALKKMPPYMQKSVTAALTNNAPLEAERLLAVHLAAQTQLFYSKASMASFGHMLGPVFTPFTRWPTAISGDIATELRTKKLSEASVRLAEKYMLPTILLATVQHTLYGDPDKMSDAQRLLVGNSGLVGAAPVLAARSIWRGDTLVPPGVSAVKRGILDPLLAGQNVRAKDGIVKVFQTFTPAAGFYRLISEDVETYFNSLEGNPTYHKVK